MSLTQLLYDRMPIVLQNMAISLYGFKLYYERYWRDHQGFLQKLLQSQWFSSEQIETYQTSKLIEMIAYAYGHIPYYRSLFEELGLSTRDFHSIADLKKLPILRKETVRENYSRFLSQELNPKKCIILNTSGTTGKTLKICVDLKSRRQEYAFIARNQKWAGLSSGRHNITFGGRVIIPNSQTAPIFWRYNAIMDNYLFSSYHLSDRNLAHYVRKIIEFQPKFIDAYPSSIYTVAKYMMDNSIVGVNPAAVLTTAETLMDFQRETIEQVFGCPVYDQYGCTEQSIFVSQCEKGTYHVHPEYGIVEIIDEEGNDVQPGETGKVICTGFINKAMPLLRYDIGDMAEMGNSICSCGRNFPVINKIHGRKDDIILTKDGRKIGRLDPIFKGLTSIKEAQIIQNRIDEVEIHLVPGSNYSQRDANVLKAELSKRLGCSMNIKIKTVDSIPRTSTGKFRSVISILYQQERTWL